MTDAGCSMQARGSHPSVTMPSGGYRWLRLNCLVFKHGNNLTLGTGNRSILVRTAGVMDVGRKRVGVRAQGVPHPLTLKTIGSFS